MGGYYAKAVLFKIFRADAECNDALAAVYKILFIAGGQLIAKVIFGETSSLCKLYSFGAGFALGLGGVEECLVAFGIAEHCLLFLFGSYFKIILLVVGQFVIEFLSLALFF